MKLPADLTFSKNGFDFLMFQENLKPKPYNDGLDMRDPLFFDNEGNGVGNCTGGYGHKIHNGACNGSPNEDYFIGIDKPEAMEILKNDVQSAEAVVKKYIFVPLTQAQYDAMVSLFFNWAYTPKYPDKINLINAGKYEEAGLHFLKGPITSGGVIMEGLLKRRYAEAVMFLTGYNVILPTLEEYLQNPDNPIYFIP